MKTIRQLMVVTAIAAAATPAMARDSVAFSVNIGPPPPHVEYVPAPRPGYVWAPGYWNWNGHRHVWVNGHSIRGRHNQHWVPDRWNHRGNGWRLERGHWGR